MDKYKVAIVDDDEVALENLSFELGKDARFSLKGTARNGKQGKKLIAKVQPDLLFLDVEMPDMTGMELLQEIRGSVSWNMRIVFYLKSASNLNGNLNCSKELEHYAS